MPAEQSPFEMSLVDMSLIALAKAASQPIADDGPGVDEAISYVLCSMPHEFRQQLALGHFGDFKNAYLKRHAVFDVEFGLAARTIQRFYRGHRSRRYLSIAENPLSKDRWLRLRPHFSMKSLFEIAPPKAFIRRALSANVDETRLGAVNRVHRAVRWLEDGREESSIAGGRDDGGAPA